MVNITENYDDTETKEVPEPELLSEDKIETGKFFKGYLIYIVILVMSAGLLIFEPHLSGTIIVLSI